MPRRLAAVAAALATAIVLFGATLPEQRRSMLHSQGVLHPWYHLGIFGVIAFLTACSTRRAGLRAALCAAVALLGCITELTEWHLYHHALEWTDMVLDAMGAVIGTMLGAFTADLRSRRDGPHHRESPPVVR